MTLAVGHRRWAGDALRDNADADFTAIIAPTTNLLFSWLALLGPETRESIEAFEIDTRPAMPAVTWIGCAIAPDPIGLNSVRGLPDGGFIATNFNARNAPMTAMMAGEVNGELWEWHTASGWEKVLGSEASGANGVDLSDDGETLYVAAWGNQKFFGLSRGGPLLNQ